MEKIIEESLLYARRKSINVNIIISKQVLENLIWNDVYKLNNITLICQMINEDKGDSKCVNCLLHATSDNKKQYLLEATVKASIYDFNEIKEDFANLENQNNIKQIIVTDATRIISCKYEDLTEKKAKECNYEIPVLSEAMASLESMLPSGLTLTSLEKKRPSRKNESLAFSPEMVPVLKEPLTSSEMGVPSREGKLVSNPTDLMVPVPKEQLASLIETVPSKPIGLTLTIPSEPVQSRWKGVFVSYIKEEISCNNSRKTNRRIISKCKQIIPLNIDCVSSEEIYEKNINGEIYKKIIDYDGYDDYVDAKIKWVVDSVSVNEPDVSKIYDCSLISKKKNIYFKISCWKRRDFRVCIRGSEISAKINKIFNDYNVENLVLCRLNYDKFGRIQTSKDDPTLDIFDDRTLTLTLKILFKYLEKDDETIFICTLIKMLSGKDPGTYLTQANNKINLFRELISISNSINILGEEYNYDSLTLLMMKEVVEQDTLLKIRQAYRRKEIPFNSIIDGINEFDNNLLNEF